MPVGFNRRFIFQWARWLGVVGLAGLCGLLSSCGDRATAQGGPGGPMGSGPMPVPVVKVQPQNLPLAWEYHAQVSGLREVEIRARVAGIIEARRFEEGAMVTKGESLYQLDPAPFQAELARSRADWQAAWVRLEQAKRDLKRIEPLLESKAVSQLEVDTAQSAQELARANLAAAVARVEQAQLNLLYSKVQSPVTGYVGRSMKDQGSLVSGPQDLLTTVTRVDEVYVNFGVPEQDHRTMRGALAQAPEGTALQVEVFNSASQPLGFSGPLSFQDVRVNPSTGTLDARARFANTDELLKPGQFVRVRLSGVSQPQAVTLPQRAVLQNPMGGKIVMTIGPEGTVAPRPVQVAQWVGEHWVVTGGLAAGDLVITDGFIKAPPGTPVQPVLGNQAPSIDPVQPPPANQLVPAADPAAAS